MLYSSAITGVLGAETRTKLRVGAGTVQIRRNGTPAYKRIQDAILKRIEAGHLRPGDAVDSERELARIHRVSLMTARHALAGLEREGLVERRRGAGTFVAPPKIHFNKLMSFTEQMASRGLTGHSKTLSASLVENEPDVAARLGLAPHSRLIRIERLRVGGNEPFAVETGYLSAEEFPALTKVPLEKASLFSILDREYGVTLVHADEEIDATGADPKTADLLQVPRGAPLLRMRQLIFSSSGKPTIYMLGLYRSDRHSLMIRRFR
jgi:GntR family transcriptional regulator